MIHSYNKLYLNDACDNLGFMYDYAVNALQYTVSDYTDLFLKSKISTRVEKGDFYLVSGCSGIELTHYVLEDLNLDREILRDYISSNTTKEYWFGSNVAYYQWLTSLSFAKIFEIASADTILSMFDIYHEMDVTQFFEAMNDKYLEKHPDSKLSLVLQKKGVTVKELSEKADVSLDVLNDLVKRHNIFKKDHLLSLGKIAKAIDCNVNSLQEKIPCDVIDWNKELLVDF